MTPAQRVLFFRDYWPLVCSAKGWRRSDNDSRHALIRECMAAVRGPTVESLNDLGDDETTALFCYADFIAHQDDLDRSARWVDCQVDYRAFNRARQADWHQRKLYGIAGGKKLIKSRFAGAQDAQGQPLDKFDPEAIRKRHITMASRARKWAQKAATGQTLASQPQASTPRPSIQAALVDDGDPF